MGGLCCCLVSNRFFVVWGVTNVRMPISIGGMREHVVLFISPG